MIHDESHKIPGARWGILAPTAPDGGDMAAVIAARGIVLPRQVHGTDALFIIDPQQPVAEADIIITSLRGVAVGVRTADCVPVVISAPDIHAVAAVHAGWRGSAAHIAAKAVRLLTEMGADPAAMHAAISAAICCDCFEVDEDVAAHFEHGVNRSPVVDPLTGRLFAQTKPHVDLPGCNAADLAAAGLSPAHITTRALCTRHSPLGLPSWRRIPGTTQRLITWITPNP